ncbi:PPM1N [Symbiodinium sp. CCMP2456]|nr:PPM1N [Symbiodinium sp. CCMP2456]
MGNICQCCGAREKDPSWLPDYASGGNGQYGYSLAKNDRQRMEDAVLIHDNVGGNACFAVFDGHGGEKATLLAKQYLPEQLECCLQENDNKEEAAKQAFTAVDELIQNELAEEAKQFASGTSSGTVACVALLKAEELVLLTSIWVPRLFKSAGTMAFPP